MENKKIEFFLDLVKVNTVYKYMLDYIRAKLIEDSIQILEQNLIFGQFLIRKENHPELFMR